MKLLKIVAVGSCILALAACSSHRNGNGANIADANGMNGGMGANGAYAQGMGGGAGFQPSANCNAPAGKEAFYFDFDSNTPHQEDMSRIAALAQNGGKFRVVGNTDDMGSREYNMALGWRRADAVATILEQHGASKQQVTTNSNGAEKPIAFGNSDDDRQCNRRVDISQ